VIYIGIDPGLNGAIAFLDTKIGHLSVVDMPILEVKRNNKVKKEVSSYGLSNIFDLTDGPAWNIREVVLERVGAMPGQGVSSVFSFGRSVGLVEGVLAARGLAVSIVTPQAWQKAAGVRGGKDGSRQRAMELFPNYAGLFALKKHDGRADAACMAWYAATR
jgi:crossover junction endodeoxyribonuclease RuvC